MIRLLKENSNQAQNQIKQTANKNITEREFKEGDMVYLHRQPFKQNYGCCKIKSEVFPKVFWSLHGDTKNW